MRKIIMMAIAGFIWKKFQGRILKQPTRGRIMRRM
jgi:hypothetical protein